MQCQSILWFHLLFVCVSVLVVGTNKMGCIWSSSSSTQEQEEQGSTLNHQKRPVSNNNNNNNNLSPVVVYDRLPPNAEKYGVRNVYDGDTLTLVNGKRVRFLGIDTPEIKEKQAFAQEAKTYTKDLCDKKEIWISYEPGYDKQDHYGRLLAFVWVRTSKGKYLCVNEGLVQQGLASFYSPKKSPKLHNYDRLLAMQKTARAKRVGIWKHFKDYTVVKTPYGSAFHKPSCKHLSNSKNTIKIMASQGLDDGLHPCRTCLADA